ncbi:UNVERIFIED_CONTAM: acylpyruvate hydrolase [Brevibacillus sp. OAP136]
MKLLTYTTNGNTFRVGILRENETIVDPGKAYCAKLRQAGQDRAEELSQALLPSESVSFLANGDFALNAAKEALAFAAEHPDDSYVFKKQDVKIGAPVLRPSKIVCVGLNYRDHIQEMKRELPKFPVIFAKYPTAISGPTDPIPLNAHLTQKLDYEGELAFVIGKTGKDIPEEQAYHYVAGYCVANDITARDMQKRTIEWTQGKTLDGSLPMGYLVTKDEIPDPHKLEIKSMVNGEVRQNSNTSQLVFDVPKLVSFLSAIFTLEPGDIICTGTPGGVGEAKDIFLKEGDVVTVEIECLGSIENKVLDLNK